MKFLFKLKRKIALIDFQEVFFRLQSNGKLLLATVIITFFLMGLAGFAIFAVNIKGAEKVLVPDVVGKQLSAALIEMQEKELYPNIQLRYSDNPVDKDTIIEQSPAPGAIRKGYSKVTLVVSRGAVIDNIENYVGQNIDDVRIKIQALFAGTARALINIGTPQYKADTSEAGTILEQDPPEGTPVTNPVTINFVVSRGPTFETTRIPSLIGNSVNDVLQQMARTRLVFDFTSRDVQGNEKAGTVVNMQTFTDDVVPNYTRVSVELALPTSPMNDNVYGIFQETLSEYPYPVSLKLTAIPPESVPYTVVSFSHPGGNVTIPYAVAKDTELVLSLVSNTGEKELKKIIVQ